MKKLPSHHILEVIMSKILSILFAVVGFVLLSEACFSSGGSNSNSGSGSSTPASSSKGAAIARTADKYRWETLWAQTSSRKNLGPGDDKCSLFVAEVLEEAGASVPHRHWLWSPIGAMEWGNPRSSYLTNDRCWTKVTAARNGDVAAAINTNSRGQRYGHVAIVTGPSLTTSATATIIKKGDWGFSTGTRRAQTFWRYTC